MFKYTAVISALILTLLPWMIWWVYFNLGGAFPAMLTVFTVLFPIGLIGTSTKDTLVHSMIGAFAFPAMMWAFWFFTRVMPDETLLAWCTSLTIIFLGFAYISMVHLIQRGD
jgi:hypothetical protein